MRMRGRGGSSSGSDDGPATNGNQIKNVRTNPRKIFDSITRVLLQLGVTLAIISFIGLIVRYAVQEFDPSISTITVTTTRVNDRDIASLSVSKNFLERILEFTEESIAIVAAIIPIGFPLCTIFNRHFAQKRAGGPDRIHITDNKVLDMIPKYVVIGDAQACQLPNSQRLRPLVRDTIYQLIKARLKPKLIVEESYEEARRLGIRLGLIRREHHRLAVIKSVDLLRSITDSKGDIKQDKVRYVLSRMKIMSQSTPADKSLLIYLMKHCQPEPNEALAYLGYSFTDPEAMRLADCAISFQDCDDEDVKKVAQVILKSENASLTDLYLFLMVCLLSSNVIQSYALYQISASVSCCLYRFLSITVFQEQLISRSQFALLAMLQQVVAIAALMTKWLASLPEAPLQSQAAELSHEATEDSLASFSLTGRPVHRMSNRNQAHHRHPGTSGQPRQHHRSAQNVSAPSMQATMQTLEPDFHRKSSASLLLQAADGWRQSGHSRASSSASDSASNSSNGRARGARSGARKHESDPSRDEPCSEPMKGAAGLDRARPGLTGSSSSSDSDLNSDSHSHSDHNRLAPLAAARSRSTSSRHIHLSGIDLNQAIIDSNLVLSYKQTFHNSSLIDDVTYRLAKLHIAYQTLVMIIIMIFGGAMFQLSAQNNRQHQTLAFNSLMMNSIFNLANCFNQLGQFNLSSGFRRHPFFVCFLLLALFGQVSLTELNAFGLENLKPIQWFVCLVFALLSALIAPLTGQQLQQHKRRDFTLNQSKQSRSHLPPPAKVQPARQQPKQGRRSKQRPADQPQELEPLGWSAADERPQQMTKQQPGKQSRPSNSNNNPLADQSHLTQIRATKRSIHGSISRPR